MYRVVSKMSQLVLSELRLIFIKVANFLAHRWPRRQNYVRYTHFPPYLIYVNALPCKTQMVQIVTLCGDYHYQIAHLSLSIRQKAPRDFIILWY